MSQDAKIDVRVEYPAAGDRLDDHGVSRDETIGSLKSRVLTAFGLKEGVDERGELLTYVLFHGHSALTDTAATVRSVAGAATEILLRLDRERHYFLYQKHKIVSPTPSATGAQIKAMIKAVDPAFDLSHTLIEEGHGHHEDKVIPDNQSVSLEVDATHPAKHFFSKPPTNFGAG
jgi:hypothetical protein